MRRLWKEKGRQVLSVLLSVFLLMGTWEASAAAAVMESGEPEQAIQEGAVETPDDIEKAGGETSGEEWVKDGEEIPEETPGEIQEEDPEEPYTEQQEEDPKEQLEEQPGANEQALLGEAAEESSGSNKEITGEPELMAGALASAQLDTKQYLLIYPAANKQYRWNSNNGGTAKNDCVHLDDNGGHNCTMKVNLETRNGGVYYYSIRYSSSGYYIDSEKDDSKAGRVLHNGKKDRKQDNQLFRFVPVKDSKGNVKKNTYYILSKKGDNEGKELYIGLDKDKNIERHRKVATSSKPMEWVVENGTVDVPSKAEKLPEKDKKTICMIYPKGYKRDINVKGDAGIKGANLHLWLHGTSSKISCVWDGDYQAYKLKPMTITEHELGTVWDVKDRSYAEGADIHTWSEMKDSLSQYWRFVSRGNGVYQIQNAYTGKYAALREAKDADGVELVTRGTPTDWQVEVINVSKQKAKSVQWMSELSDNLLLSDINIPASHDAGTAWTSAFGLNTSDAESISISKCQQLFIEEQLNVGVRAFDLRVYEGDDNDNPDIIHGGQYAQCRKQDYSHLGLQDVLQKTTDFLQANPRETVIIKVGAQGLKGKTENVAKAIDHNIQSGRYPIYKPDKAAVPRLGEVRGKIVLMRAFSFGDYKPASKETYFGLDLVSGWGGDYDKIPGARQIYDKDGCRIWVQDAYKVNVTDKRSHVEKTIAQANGGEIPAGAYILNFTSCTDPSVIINGARNMTSWFLSRDARGYREGKKLGIVLMDYIDAKMARAIYSNPPVETVTFPQQVSMTYGQSLSKASAKGGSAPGSFSFKDPNIVPSKAGTHVFTMVFTPFDPEEPSIEQDVTVTVKKAAQRLKNSAASLKRKVVGKTVKNAIKGAHTKLTFASSNTDVVRVNKDGRIRFVGIGKAVITVRAAESENYQAASKKYTVTVIPKTAGIKNLTSPGKGQILFKIRNMSKDYTGYEVKYRVNNSKKVYTRKLKKGSLKEAGLDKFKSGDVIRLKIRAYKEVGKKTYYGRYSGYKKIKVK